MNDHSATQEVRQQLWFLNSLVTLQLSHTEGSDQISILEHQVPYGDSPPRHRHLREVEIFQIVEGNFRFELEGQVLVRGPGAVVLIPRLAVHTYRVESRSGGRFITITRGGEFEDFVRALGRPAARPELPVPAGPPTREQQQELVNVAREYGIEILGPPLTD